MFHLKPMHSDDFYTICKYNSLSAEETTCDLDWQCLIGSFFVNKRARYPMYRKTSIDTIDQSNVQNRAGTVRSTNLAESLCSLNLLKYEKSEAKT